MRSCLYEGFIMHRRLDPVLHSFRYRLFLVFVDLAEVDSLFGRRGVWSTVCFRQACLNRPRPLASVEAFPHLRRANMAAFKRGDMPPELARLRERLLSWRSARKRGARVPPALWKAAAKLAAVHGVGRTSKVLRLAFYTLKDQVEQVARHESRGDAPPTFVELHAPAATGECQAEFESRSGAKIRVQWSGGAVVNLTELVRTWLESP